MSPSPVSVFWFRRDLRLDDNHGLYEFFKYAQERDHVAIPIFIFDKNILDRLPRDDHRVGFIQRHLSLLDKELRARGSKLHVYVGKPRDVYRRLLSQHRIEAIFTNEDYEPYAIERDGEIAKLAARSKAEFKSFKDQVVFAKNDVTKDDGSPYRMFTPYSRKWLAAFKNQNLQTYASKKHVVPLKAEFDKSAERVPSLKELGFTASKIKIPELDLAPSLIKKYSAQRDFLALAGTTHAGVHLRFGTLSVRHCVKLAETFSEVWLKELIWREFFQQILFHYPHTAKESFDQRFRQFPWRPLDKSKKYFEAWKEGRTGYPIVDAGMRELNQTGFMHNRARMIVGSFLTKHLLIDWRFGERYFAEKLFDFELSSNVGNWQWVAGTGCDAAPYFRIFNPELQAKKFDKSGEYVRKWIPELDTEDYPQPIVDHELARRRALTAYAKVKVLKK